MTLLLGLLPVGSPADFPADAVMKLCMPALESGDEKLRNMGVAVAAEAYRHHGKAVPVHTRHLPAGVLRLLDKKFVAIDKAKAAAGEWRRGVVRVCACGEGRGRGRGRGRTRHCSRCVRSSYVTPFPSLLRPVRCATRRP